MYYGLIIVSVLMFGGGFALQDVYRKMRGSGLRFSMESSFIGSSAGLIVLLILNGFQWEFTPFTLLMACFAALINVAFVVCSFRALDVINLSLFSVFSMLGGMALPFLQGILFYHEGITLAKILCILLICIALLLTVERGERRGGAIWYIGIFVLNGLAGVVSKLFTSAPFEKASAAGYSVWVSILGLLLSGSLWLILTLRQKEKAPRYTLSAGCAASASGALNKIGNFLLLIALAHVDASVQYPMVTGGVMIVSTVICFFGANKPSRREMLSVLVAFLGMLALFAIPI